MRVYLFFMFIGIFLTSCALNKNVSLYPIEPLEIYENNVRFSISSSQQLWIGFQWPLANSQPEAYFIMFISSNENIERASLKSISINIKELDFIYTKNEEIELQNRAPLPNSEYNYFSVIRIEIPTNEILNEYNSNVFILKRASCYT